METTNLPVINPKLNLTTKIATKFEQSKRIKVSFTNCKAKLEIKKGSHKEGRMKVTLKFNRDEAEGFSNFCKLAKPENLSQDDFVKFIFYKGVEALQNDFSAKLEQFKQENPEEFARIKAEIESQSQQAEGSLTIADDIPKL
jgi:transketolase